MSIAMIFLLLTIGCLVVPGLNPMIAPPYISLALIFYIVSVICFIIGR